MGDNVEAVVRYGEDDECDDVGAGVVAFEQVVDNEAEEEQVGDEEAEQQGLGVHV